MFQPEDLICSYTRKQAIEDGLQVCVSERFPDDTKMFNYPVYFTAEVWKLCQEKGVIVWDICYMAAMATKAKKDDSSIVNYFVVVERAKRKPDFFENACPSYCLLAEVAAKDIDQPEPVITIMFPDER